MTVQSRVLGFLQQAKHELWLAKREWGASEESAALVCAHCSRALQYYLRALLLAHRRKLPAEILEEELVEEACEELPELFPLRESLRALVCRPEGSPWEEEDPLPGDAGESLRLVEEIAKPIGRDIFHCLSVASVSKAQ